MQTILRVEFDTSEPVCRKIVADTPEPSIRNYSLFEFFRIRIFFRHREEKRTTQKFSNVQLLFVIDS